MKEQQDPLLSSPGLCSFPSVCYYIVHYIVTLYETLLIQTRGWQTIAQESNLAYIFMLIT